MDTIDVTLSESRFYVLQILKDFETYSNECYLIGAMARDILFDDHKNIRPPIATADVDFAIMVESWDKFNEIKNYLIANKGYQEGEFEYRIYKDGGGAVDVIPYGGVERTNSSISFPGEEGTVLSVLGFSEVADHSCSLNVNSTVRVRVASPAGIVILKMISWNGRRDDRSKDVQDIFFIMRHYTDYLGVEAWERYPDVMDEEPFDWNMASSRILGRDIGQILKNDAGVKAEICSMMDELTVDQYSSAFVLKNDRRSFSNDHDAFLALQTMKVGLLEV